MTLDAADLEHIRECLSFVLHSDQLEGEFSTRLGVHEAEVSQILTAWPSLDLGDLAVRLAVNNALNEVCNGLDISSADWATSFSCSRDEMRQVFGRYKGASKKNGTA